MNASRWLFRLLLGRRLPITSGELAVPGIDGKVVIRRDRWGIPTIDADNDYDAWYGLGFCHGQDRAFQLESLLRVARGTLAELVGKGGVPIDRLSRRIGFGWSAKSQMSVLDPDIIEMLDAYASGVTAGATIGVARKAHEFTLLKSQPTAWTAFDALGVLKLQSFALVSNWDVELARYKILVSDGRQALADLDPHYSDWLPVTMPPGTHAGLVLDRLSEDVAAFLSVVKPGGGSNNWALAASKTKTGRPLLANDPHLPGTLPPHWYLAHVRTPHWQVAGASFLGGPIFPAGHNGHASWGVTVGLVDNTDLFLEELKAKDKTYRQGKDFLACEIRTETIAVKGGEDVEEEVLSTPRGPIISPALENVPEAFSIRATWLDPHPVRGLLALHRVRSFAEFRESLSKWPALAFNVVYADASGAIGWQMTGLAPRRKKGFGTLPQPGWDKDNGWHEEGVPFEQMPFVENPSVGFVATANNKPNVDGPGPFLTTDFADGYRVAAIVDALGKHKDWDIDSTFRLQKTVDSLPWREMKDMVIRLPGGNALADRALQLLRDWDGVVGPDSPAAAVFEFFVAEMSLRVARSKAPKSYEYALGRGWSPIAPIGFFAERRVSHLVNLIRRQPPGWFARSWSEEIVDALAAVIQRLQDSFGKDSSRWAWGRVRPLMLRHPVGRKGGLFGRIFNLGPISFGGDANTIAQAAVEPLDPTSDPVFLPSLRMAIDVGNWSASRFALPGGQSGNPLSPHYADQLPIWQNGEGIPIAWTDQEIQQSTQATLRLTPSATKATGKTRPGMPGASPH